MKPKTLASLSIFVFCFNEPLCTPIETLKKAKQIDNAVYHNRPPNTYNNQGMGGYFAMPSARSPETGDIHLGFVNTPPYQNSNLSLSVFRFLQLGATYHLFKGVPDTFLGPGFGDVADRSANFKLVFLRPEDSAYLLPGVAFGIDDCLGTQAFRSEYLVATYVYRPLQLELSLGYGRKRINGFFGGVAVSPFHKTSFQPLHGLTLMAEYDATDYTNPTFEPSPLGREVKTRLNVGLQYRIFNLLNVHLNTIRGKKIAVGFSLSYNFGNSKGLVSKFKNKALYRGPHNKEPVGAIRTHSAFGKDLAKALRDQGVGLFRARIFVDKNNVKRLYIRVVNKKYRSQQEVKSRIARVLSNLLPGNIESVVVQLDSDTIPVVQYTYTKGSLEALKSCEMSARELSLITKEQNISPFPKGPFKSVWEGKRETLSIIYKPFVNFFVGSASGKVKYNTSLILGPSGYIANKVFYKVMIGFHVVDNFANPRGVDKVNPSQIINVRSDSILYYRSEKPYVEKAYLQKNFNIAPGWFGRVAAGYFEIAYAGFAGEVLLYPARSNWAVGFEGAVVKKRKYNGLGLTNYIRRFVGFTPTQERFLGTQYFCNLYYDIASLSLEGHLRLGQFLAKDWGGVLTLTRYFPSGVRLSAWYGITDVKDIINGKRYNQIGVRVSVPLDLFLPTSSKSRIGTGGTAWLRDNAAVSDTGSPLYGIVRKERRNH